MANGRAITWSEGKYETGEAKGRLKISIRIILTFVSYSLFRLIITSIRSKSLMVWGEGPSRMRAIVYNLQ